MCKIFEICIVYYFKADNCKYIHFYNVLSYAFKRRYFIKTKCESIVNLKELIQFKRDVSIKNYFKMYAFLIF